MNYGIYEENRSGWGILKKKKIFSKDGRSLQGGKNCCNLGLTHNECLKIGMSEIAVLGGLQLSKIRL